MAGEELICYSLGEISFWSPGFFRRLPIPFRRFPALFRRRVFFVFFCFFCFFSVFFCFWCFLLTKHYSITDLYFFNTYNNMISKELLFCISSLDPIQSAQWRKWVSILLGFWDILNVLRNTSKTANRNPLPHPLVPATNSGKVLLVCNGTWAVGRQQLNNAPKEVPGNTWFWPWIWTLAGVRFSCSRMALRKEGSFHLWLVVVNGCMKGTVDREGVLRNSCFLKRSTLAQKAGG